MKNYYQLLEIEPSASADEIKKAFRLQIARYHPDKVQHLGKEFQAMAADRAAELTEGYRILSDAGRRAEYDQLRTTIGATEDAAPPPPSAAAEPQPSQPSQSTAPPRTAETGAHIFSEERGHRDEFVRRASLGRLHSALERVLGDSFEQPSVRGFDLAVVPKAKLFARSRDPRLLVRFVSSVDGEAVADAWTAAAKWAAIKQDEVCVLLIGSAVAPMGELATAIGEQRRKPAHGAKVTLVPVDARDWQAHFPTDAPKLAHTLIEGLQKQR